MTVTIEKPDIITLMFRQERSDTDYGSCLWARFYLDLQNYTMSIESDCGNYSYGWIPTPDHETFLELLCRMNRYYLLDKLAQRSVVDGESTWKSIKELLESEELTLDELALHDLEVSCHQQSAQGVISDVVAILDDTECGAITGFDIAQCIELDYKAGAKKIVDVFKTAIVPPLKEMLAKDTNVLTNADRIRAMNDKELAKWLLDVMSYKVACFGEGAFPYAPCRNTEHDCVKCGVAWLKQPVEG